MQFIDLGAQYRAYRTDIDSAIQRVIETTMFIQGGEVSSLEKELAEYIGVSHCVSCASGTDALQLALMALGVGPGDEVVTSPFSFFATAEVISLLGATPVFCDIDPVTYNLDRGKLEGSISQRTKAVMPVSIFGQPADMDAINQIADRHGLPVIEDGAQSFGAEYNGRKSCGVSTIGCTSFFPTKPLGCYGDGGALFTNDGELAEKLRMLMNHGQTGRYQHAEIGLNSRLDAIQAAILRVKLRHLDEELQARQHIADRYNDGLAGVAGLTTPRVVGGRTSAWAQYSIQADNREALIAGLKERDVPSAIHYPTPIYRQEVYEDTVGRYGECPVTERLCARVMSLPMYPFMAESDVDLVCGAVAAGREGVSV
jgi:UDP-2-acetamido-2-deoxy-ribo-hexuluronate aminotransferase